MVEALAATLTSSPHKEANVATHKTNISLRTLTQASLNRLTRAFPQAKQMLAHPESRKVTHMMTLEFTAARGG